MKKTQTDGWEKESGYIDFKTPEDLQKCIRWVKLLLKDHDQALLEKIENIQEYIIDHPNKDLYGDGYSKGVLNTKKKIINLIREGI